MDKIIESVYRPKKPRISVVMSVHNGEKYLRESVESILKQTFTGFEFIIINDGSVDETYEILTKYASLDNRIVLVHQEKIGLTKSLNKAIRMARGEYIARQDADDISLENRFEMQINFLTKNKEYSLLGTSCFYISENGKIIGDKIFSDRVADIKKNCIKENQFVHSSVLIKKEALLEVGCYSESYIYGQDYELWLRFLKKYNGTNLKNKLVKKRITISGIGTSQRRKRMLLITRAALAHIIIGNYSIKNIFVIGKHFAFYLIPDFIWAYLRKKYSHRSLTARAFDES